MKKIVSSVLVIVMCLGISGCGSFNDDTVAKINGDPVSKGMLEYFVFTVKNSLASENTSNLESFWDEGTIEGVNAGQYVKEQAMEAILTGYVIRQQAIKNGSDLTDTEKNEIETSRQATIEQFGGLEQYKEALKPYGLTDEVYTEMLKNRKYEQNYFASVKGKYTDDELKKYYTQNMFRIKHVLISNKNSETEEALQGDDLAMARATAADIEKRAKDGEDFDKLVAEYSQDPGSQTSPDGYLMGSASSMVKPFLEKSVEMKEGEVSDIVETMYGYHILKKYPVVESEFEAQKDSIINEYWQYAVSEWGKDAKVEYNKPVFDAVSVAASGS
ncbi:MAG: peptidylprolyl isomerase [Clostridiales bacterium]|jgi:parvulin-like peptidyl-prolyl isomerase|nr:peptidylprolyl isomerase [Clostridiales bacterium]